MSVRVLISLLLLALLLPSSSSAMSVFPRMAKEPMPEPEPDLEQMLVLASAYERLMADLVVVEKSKRRLYLLKDDRPFRSYPISLGFAPEGHKEQKGDGRTPEGRYYLNWRQYSNNFYRSIHISYPNEEDRLNAAREGNDPGGMIMIHGQPRSNAHRELQEILRSEDWTRGCIAVSDSAIDEIWKATRNGTPIEIRP